MSLEIALGPGATQAFEAAVTFPDDQPTIVYGDWQAAAANNVTPAPPVDWITTDSSDQTPGPGQWRTATVIWNNGASQKAFFQDRVFFWGSGLCEATPSDLDRMGNAAMWSFFEAYIDEMFIDLPPLPAFIEPFLNIGFEVLDETGPLTRVHSPIHEGCRMQQWIEWREDGEPAETEPDWRV